MQNHMNPNNGSEAALSLAVKVLSQVRATLDTVFEDDAKDLSDPSRKPFLRRQYQELGAAIEEIRRAQSAR